MMCSTLKSRRGKFELDDRLIDTDPDLLMIVMGLVIVTRAEHDFMNGRFQYYGYSPFFQILDEGEITPWYVIELDDESFEIEFHRQGADYAT